MTKVTKEQLWDIVKEEGIADMILDYTDCMNNKLKYDEVIKELKTSVLKCFWRNKKATYVKGIHGNRLVRYESGKWDDIMMSVGHNVFYRYCLTQRPKDDDILEYSMTEHYLFDRDDYYDFDAVGSSGYCDIIDWSGNQVIFNTDKDEDDKIKKELTEEGKRKRFDRMIKKRNDKRNKKLIN